MSQLEIIDSLCALVEQQSLLIRELAFALAEADCLSDETRQSVLDNQKIYSEILGAEQEK